MALPKVFYRKLKKSAADKAYREKNIESAREKDREKYLRSREKRLEQVRAYRAANLEKVREYDRQRNAVRRVKNAAYYRAKTQERRNPGRTPPWANIEAMAFIQFQAGHLGAQVDHIVPLRGENVCGLNTQENLQLLYPQANQAKWNRFSNEQYQEWRKNGESGPFLPK